MVTEDGVRRLALALPETAERLSYGTPGFRVRDKLFARIHQGGDAVLVWCRDPDEREALLAARADVCFTTPHYDGHPSVLVRLAAVDADELADLLAEAWRARAPKTARGGAPAPDAAGDPVALRT